MPTRGFWWAGCLAIMLGLVACQAADTGGSPVAKQWSSPPAMTIDPDKQYSATIKTSMGDMTAELYAKDAPITVNNFVFLANQHFYDNVSSTGSSRASWFKPETRPA